MALVERLMRDASEARERWIPIHFFFAAMSELDRGAVTVANVKTTFAMTAADEVDFDALIAIYQGLPDEVAKLRFINQVHSVFILAEPSNVDKRPVGYKTPADIRSKLGGI